MEDGSGTATDAFNDHPNGMLVLPVVYSSRVWLWVLFNGVTSASPCKCVTSSTSVSCGILDSMNHMIDDIDESVKTRKNTAEYPPLFTAKEVSSSIIASENTRIIFSLSIALVVVLSYIDYPLLGINIVNSKSIIALRPLYMIFITEITVLFAYLVLERQRRFEHDRSVLKGGGVNWERAERLLEGGLVVHQTVRAVFIDFSVYVVTIICMLSLATRV